MADNIEYLVPIGTIPPSVDAVEVGQLWFSELKGELYVLYEDPDGNKSWVQTSVNVDPTQYLQ